MNNKSIVFTSDPQYPWTDVTDDRGYETEAEKVRRSQALIGEQYNSINEYNSNFGVNTRVIINGDLTAFGHDWQRRVMSQIMRQLVPPFCYGLGNHDIENNYWDTVANKAAFGAMDDYANHYWSLNLPNKSWDVSQDGHRYAGSFNYSWDEGRNFHIIQLNNYPGMTGYDYHGFLINQYNIYYLGWDVHMRWLRGVLDRAQRQNKNIIINVHKPNTWPESALEAIKELLIKYNVIAVFAGHYHKICGYNHDYTNYMGGKVPVFLSGSASQRTYLITESDDENMFVYLVRENNWRNKSLIHTLPLKKTNLPENNAMVTFTTSYNRKAVSRMRDNSSIVIWGRDDSPLQKFVLIKAPGKGDDVYQIWDPSMTQIVAWNRTAGDTVFMHHNENKDEHFWHLLPQDNGGYIIANLVRDDGILMVLDVTRSLTADGTIIGVFDRNDTPNQLFYLHIDP